MVQATDSGGHIMIRINEKDTKAVENERLDLLLVSPCLDFEQAQKKRIAMRIDEKIPNQESPPLGIGYLIAIAKEQGLKTRFIDMGISQLTVEDLIEYIRKAGPKLVGFAAYTIQIKSAAFIARQIKKRFPALPVCVGGVHATVTPKETLEEFESFDFAVCGEAEMLLPELLEKLDRGTSLSGVPGVVTRETQDFSRQSIEHLDSLPFPAWEQFNLDDYQGCYPHRTNLELPMSTSRGCPYSCVFCVRAFGQRRRSRSVESVLSEIERNIEDFGCESICFVDETFMFDLKWCNELFAQMIKRGLNKKITWSCSTRVNNVSPDLFKLMRKAGCYYVFFGLESGDDTILKTIKKKITIDQIRKAIQWAKQAKLICVGSFIIGLPGETEETVNRNIELAQELDLYSVTFPIAVPFPRTELRDMAEKHEYGLRILSDNWDDYGKQYPGVMESDDLSIEKRRELQKKGYELNPKKNIEQYIQRVFGEAPDECAAVVS
jgi:radical SAM superfamily enzyme YgiQ (UPF0313 family)